MGSMSPLKILDAGLNGLTSLVTTAVPILTVGSQAVRDVRNFGRDAGADAAKEAARALEAQQTLAMTQLQAQQELGERQAAQDAALEQRAAAVESDAAETARRAALKRAVARQKVSLASQGISAVDGGSAEAILLGLFSESEQERAARDRLDGLRSAAAAEGLAQKRALNVLQRSQLAERQRLERALQG